MGEPGVSTTLTVFHDGQFWVGVFERVDSHRLSVCRVVFGAEPSAEELLAFVRYRYDRLVFSPSVQSADQPILAGNPKRRQREAAKALQQRGISTKAQAALAEARELSANAHKTSARMVREEEKDRRFALKREKRKRRHRGH